MESFAATLKLAMRILMKEIKQIVEEKVFNLI